MRLCCACVTRGKRSSDFSHSHGDILHAAVSAVHTLLSAAPRLPPVTQPVIYQPQSECRFRMRPFFLVMSFAASLNGD